MNVTEMIVLMRKTKPVVDETEEPFAEGYSCGKCCQWEFMCHEVAVAMGENVVLFKELCE